MNEKVYLQAIDELDLWLTTPCFSRSAADDHIIIQQTAPPASSHTKVEEGASGSLLIHFNPFNIDQLWWVIQAARVHHKSCEAVRAQKVLLMFW